MKQKCEEKVSKDKSVSLEMRAIRLLEGDEVFIECPYLTGHTIQKKDIKNHLARCSDRFKSPIIYDVCPFNNDHIMDIKELQEHIKMCENNPENIQNSKRRRIEEVVVKKDVEIESNTTNNNNKNSISNIPQILRNLSPLKSILKNPKHSDTNGRIGGGMKERSVYIDLTDDIPPDEDILNVLIDSLFGLTTEWEILLGKIEKENKIELKTLYQSNDNKVITYVLKILHRIYDNETFFEKNYKAFPTDIIHGIIKYEERILSDKRNISDVMHFVSNLCLVDRGFQLLNLQMSDS